ncbi:MAG: MarC family protein [Planctomycetota bacterium]
MIPAVKVFIALFVVMNSLPVLPMVAKLTSQLGREERQPVVRRALFAGCSIAVVLILIGPWLFDVLGITLSDLRIAGGLILAIFAIHDLLFSTERRKEEDVDNRDTGIVPLGIPLLVGPGTLTTSMVLADAYGRGIVVAAFLTNALINLLLLTLCLRFVRTLGSSFFRALGKIYSLLLAALAVSMLRTGIMTVVNGL